MTQSCEESGFICAAALHGTVCFSEISQCATKVRDVFLVGNLYLSFLEVLVCVQNMKRETDLYNKLANAQLCFSLKAEQLFFLMFSGAKQMGLILIPTVAKPSLLILVPEGSLRRQCQLPVGHRGSLSMACCGSEAVTAFASSLLLLEREHSRQSTQQQSHSL